MSRKKRVYSRKYDLDKIFNFIVRYKTEHDGNSPSIGNIALYMAMPSSSTVNTYLKLLTEKGLIMDTHGQTRAIEVVGGSWTHNGIKGNG